MARIYRRPNRGNVFYIDLKDARGIRRGVKGYPSRRHTEELARRLEQLRDARQTGAPLPSEAERWLETQPPERIRHFVELGFLAPGSAAVGQPLRQLLADWIAALEAKGRDARYVFQNRRHVEGVLDDGAFAYWNDVTPAKINAALDAYARREGLSARTRNARLVAFRGFNRWCEKHGRVLADHTAPLELADVRVDRRLVRRALPPEHLTRLLSAALTDDGVLYGLTGRERALVYLTAASTGWRWSELRKLRRRDFRLDATPPMLAPPASTQKAGREDEVPLRADVATALRNYFTDHPLPSEAPAFPMPKSNAGAKLLRHDLARTGDNEATAAAKRERGEAPVTPIPYQDEHGEVADFHALRHALATMLGDAKVDVKAAQTIMRHSDVSLTLNIYTHTHRQKQAAALESLPPILPPTTPAPEAATPHPDDDPTPPAPRPDGGSGGDAVDGDGEGEGRRDRHGEDVAVADVGVPVGIGAGKERPQSPTAAEASPVMVNAPQLVNTTRPAPGVDARLMAGRKAGVTGAAQASGAEAWNGNSLRVAADMGGADMGGNTRLDGHGGNERQEAHWPNDPEVSPVLGVNAIGAKQPVPQGVLEEESLLTQWNSKMPSFVFPSHPTNHQEPPLAEASPSITTRLTEPDGQSGRVPGRIWSDKHRHQPASSEKTKPNLPTPSELTTHEKRPTSEEVGLAGCWHPLRDSNPCSQTENLMCLPLH